MPYSADCDIESLAPMGAGGDAEGGLAGAEDGQLEELSWPVLEGLSGLRIVEL